MLERALEVALSRRGTANERGGASPARGDVAAMEREHCGADHRRGQERTHEPQDSPPNVQADERAHVPNRRRASPRDRCVADRRRADWTPRRAP